MRKLRITMIFCLLAAQLIPIAGLNAQEWKEINRFSPAQTIQKIKFLNSELGYCVSSLYNGSTMNIYKTTNGGLSWTSQNSGFTSMRFMDIFILDEQSAWICGNEGIVLKTTDGGQNWILKSTGTKEQIWGIFFTDELHGHACGSTGLLLRTSDGGETWEQRPSNISNLFYSIHFINSNKGFASGSNVLMSTEDGGESWFKVAGFPFSPPADWIRNIVFVNDQLGFACADIGRLYKTTDGGSKWIRLESGTEEALMGLDFANEKVGVAVGFNGTIVMTDDGGDTWNPMHSPLGAEHLFSVDLISAQLGFIASHQGRILKNEILTVSSEEPRKTSLPWFNQTGKVLSVQFDHTERLGIYNIAGQRLPLHCISQHFSLGLYDASGLLPGLYFACKESLESRDCSSFVID
ncbi:MAG: hypothetical protein IPM48_08360 [Saprospiraceae bacterium]|nr:hypothetical protein [Saprospiraceae bacterium]